MLAAIDDYSARVFVSARSGVALNDNLFARHRSEFIAQLTSWHAFARA